MRPSMSDFLPAPSMIVVFSFSIRTRLALPSIWSVTFSSLMPRSSAIIVPPVRTAMSSHRLAAIAEPGGLNGCDLETASQFVDDERRERLALDVLGDNEQWLACLNDRLEERQYRL